MPAVDNADGFFTGLKQYDDNIRGCKKLRMSKAERKQYEIMQMQARKAEMDARILAAQNDLQAIMENGEAEDSSSSDSEQEDSFH